MNIKEIVKKVSLMKQNHVCIYGCGKMGTITMEVLDSLGITVEKVADKVIGKQFGTYVTASIEELVFLDKKVVCVVSILNGAEKETNQLTKYFETVLDMELLLQLKYYLDYYIPKDLKLGERVYPFNHYQSPYISKVELDYLEDSANNQPLDVNLNSEKQLEYWSHLKSYFKEFDCDLNNGRLRYQEENGMFARSDATVLYSIIRDKEPKRIIEIGSGFSSGIMMDVNKYYFEKKIDIHCIEPFPDRLKANLQNDNICIHNNYLQKMDLSLFDSLDENDILFIDSSHVAKSGSDVVIELFQILPRLKKNVIIHIHDIGYQFSYPMDWIMSGDCYNEAFLVQALLTNNNQYQIMLYVDMMKKMYPDIYFKEFTTKYGMSLWVKKMY